MKTKDIIITIIIAIVILAGLIWIARTQAPNNSGPTPNANVGVLEAVENSFDFGSVSMAAGKVAHIFKIKNPNPQPITVGKIYSSCMCTTATIITDKDKKGPFGMPGHGFNPPANVVINSNEEASVEVFFDPAAHGPAGVGRIDRVVYLEAGSNLPLELKIAATVMP